jgi:hypothetical protein
MNKSRFVYLLSLILIIFLSYRIGTWVFRYKNPIYVTIVEKEIIPIDSMMLIKKDLKPDVRYERVKTSNVFKTTKGFLLFKDSVISLKVDTNEVKD